MIDGALEAINSINRHCSNYVY